MLSNLTGWHLVILIGVVVLLFGAKKLPEAARALGQSARVFKGEMRGLRDEDKTSSRQSRPAPGALSAGAQSAYRAEPPTAEPPAAGSGPSTPASPEATRIPPRDEH